MRAMPVVLVAPAGEVACPLFGSIVGSGMDPLAQGGLDEALYQTRAAVLHL